MRGIFVPDDDCTPCPLTFERLVSTLTSMGFAADVLVEGRVRYHRSSVEQYITDRTVGAE